MTEKKKPPAKKQLKKLRLKFYKTRDQDLWLKSYRLAKKNDLEPDELVLAWIYCQEHTRKLSRPMLFTAPSAVSFCQSLKRAIDLYGDSSLVEEVIRTVFTEMDWVNVYPLDFILNVDNFNRFIEPAMQKKKKEKKKGGEQAEWTGPPPTKELTWEEVFF